MREFRVFISSPGDASIERRRADNVVSRLNGEFAALARLATVRWETEHYKAHETFQLQIPPAADCDVVVGILRWRLGTELPPGFESMPSGTPYPSGTAYEILTAIDKRHRGGDLPDVFVFRYAGGAPLSRSDDPARESIDRDWAALQGFFARWFVTQQGQFIAALNSYQSEDDFERQLERLLRKWLADKVAAGHVLRWPKTKGSPFRALNAFGAKHAPVFFGRAADVRKTMDLWRDYAARGQRFLLVVGASGAGKSSLARAGIIPRLTTPGVVPEVDLWRIAVTRPADSPQGPFAALAAALMLAAADLSPDEEGRGPALPEIAEGDSKTPAELAVVLAHADASAVKPILNALTTVGTRARASDNHGREMRCDLVLLIDQLDELFAPSLAPQVRESFADLMAAFVASGRVWLAATLRADLYESMLGVPALKVLKDGGASYDLAPPGQPELAEIVRAPAEAAGLVFADDPKTGERLDERLLREADRPDMLPLIQLALARLWEQRETIGTDTVLPLAAFEASGGLEGIIAEVGEGALAKADEASRAKLPALIRRLAEVSRGQAGATGLTARAVPLAEAAPDPASRMLVDTLVEARLLTRAEEAGTLIVRLAHQRVLGDWPRAQKIVAESADFHRVRDDVEAQRRRWDEGRRRGEFLLRGRALAEARDMTSRYGGELADATRAYIAASRRRATRAQVTGWTAAAVFAIVAVIAAGAAYIAQLESKEEHKQLMSAINRYDAAIDAVQSIVSSAAVTLQSSAGVRIETRLDLLETARRTIDKLSAPGEHDDYLRKLQASTLLSLGEAYLAAGNVMDARSAAEDRLAIARKLSSLDPLHSEYLLWTSLSLLGGVEQDADDRAGAIARYQESLATARDMAANARERKYWFSLPLAHFEVSDSLTKLGRLKLEAGDETGALAAYEESLVLARQLVAPREDDAQALKAREDKLGDIFLAQSIAGADRIDRSVVDELAALQLVRAVRLPPRLRQRLLAIALMGIGDVKLAMGDPSGALAASEESLAIARKLAVADPRSAMAQNFLSVRLQHVAEARLEAGDQAGATAADREATEIARTLETPDPGNVWAKEALAAALDEGALLALTFKDPSEALKLADEAIQLRPDLVWLYTNRAHALMLMGHTDEARALYLKYRGSQTQGNVPWDRKVEDEFAILRRYDISTPLMGEITTDFSKPSN